MATQAKKPRRSESTGEDPLSRSGRSVGRLSGDGEVELTPWQKAERMLRHAIENGTHGKGAGHFCTGCRQMVDAIVWGEAQSKTNLCEACYVKAKGGTDAVAHDRPTYVKPKRIYRPNLEDVLLFWAMHHFRDAFDAFAQGGEDWKGRVLASIVRRRARTEPGWFETVVDGKFFSELVKLAPKIVRVGPYPMNKGQTLAQAMADLRACPV